MSTEPRYAHDVIPHPEEGESVPLETLVRYHYAQALAWHLAFADAISTASLGQLDFPLSQYLGHSHRALIFDALAQGLAGQEAADWSSLRNHSESAELVWERACAYGLDPDGIRGYSYERRSKRDEEGGA